MGNGNLCEFESESVRKLLGYSHVGCVAATRLQAHTHAWALRRCRAHAQARSMADCAPRRPRGAWRWCVFCGCRRGHLALLSTHVIRTACTPLAHVASFQETLATGQPVTKAQEMRLMRADGGHVWLFNRFTHHGTRWHAVLRDISEHKRMQARCARRIARAARSALLRRRASAPKLPSRYDDRGRYTTFLRQPATMQGLH